MRGGKEEKICHELNLVAVLNFYGGVAAPSLLICLQPLNTERVQI